MEKKKLFARLRDRLAAGVRRFYVPCAYTVAAMLYAVGYAIGRGGSEWYSDETLFQFVSACMLGIALSATIRILCERRGNTARAWLYGALLSAPCAAAFFILVQQGNATLSLYTVMAGVGLGIAAVLLACALIAGENGAGDTMRALLSAVVSAGLTALAALAGLMVILQAVETLLVDMGGAAFSGAMSVIFTLAFAVGVNVLLAGIPLPGSAVSPPRAYRTAIERVLLPLYLLLLAVLYLYIGKIALTWRMPSGEMNPFGLAAAGGFLLLWLMLRGETGRLTAWYTRWGGLLLLPVTAVQLVGVGIRVSAYGLTSARYLAIAFTLLALFGAVCAIFRLRTRTFLYAAAALTLLVTITPLNAVDVPLREQEQRLEVLLETNGMLAEDGGIVAPRGTLPYDAYERIRGSYRYLRDSEGRRSAFGRAAADSKILEDANRYAEQGDAADTPLVMADKESVWTRYSGMDGYAIEGYKRIYPLRTLTVSQGEEISVGWASPAGERIDVPLTAQFDALRRQYQAWDGAYDNEPYRNPMELDAPIRISVDDTWTMLLTEAMFTFELGAYTDATIEGFLLEK